MKLFISADIEGCAGTTLHQECHKGEAIYAPFARQMTQEVVAVCLAAQAAGATELVVKDGHGDACNIDVMAMPEGVTLIRGKSGHPSNMMFGLDETFDAVLFLGYHAPAGNNESPLSHTSTGASNEILLNGTPMSEFLLNSYTAASYGVPIIFLSGDEGICRIAQETLPHIHTVSTKVGVGGSALCTAPATVMKQLSEAVTAAVTSNFSKGALPLPESFTYQVHYKDLKKAYQMSFYPNMESITPRINQMRTTNWMDVLTAHSFVVY